MSPGFRTVAFLMLLAGLSLGIFASRALRALRPADVAPAAGALVAPQIEQQVQLYQRVYQLDEREADLVRRELIQYRSAVGAKLLELRQEHAADFDSLRTGVTRRIDAILKEAGADAGR